MQDPPDLSQLAEDWITLWQSELAALATDPELAEAWAASVALAAAFWRAQATRGGMLHPWMAGLDPFSAPFGAAARAAGPDAPPRPAPAAAAPAGQPDAGGGGDGLAGRIAELERRLAEIAGGAARAGADRGRARRPRRKP